MGILLFEFSDRNHSQVSLATLMPDFVVLSEPVSFLCLIFGATADDCPIVWLAAFLAFCLALPSLGSSVAFAAATSIATIGLYISYGVPILIGLIYHREFTAKKGPFNLGIFSRPVAIVACGWIGFITVVFCLPTANPVNSQTLNYTIVAVGIIAIFSLVAWVVWAHRWFVGPLREIEAERNAGIDPSDPSEIAAAEKEGRLDVAPMH